MTSESNKDNTKELESELATSLASLKPYRLKRSWIHFPKQGSEIGVGGYGTVHRAKLQKQIFRSKVHIAVKKLYTTGDWDKRVSVSLAFAKELLVWASLKHSNVLPLLGFHLSVKLDEAWLVSPLAPKGNIFEFLEHEQPPLEKRLELSKDTAKGLDYLHTRSPPICHGDIKAVNVLVSADEHAMLCDFGLSRTAENTSITTSLNAGGTVRYSAPELLTPDSQPTLESDVWGWGCLLLEIATGRTPYGDVPLEGRVIHQITANIPPATLGPRDCPKHVLGLLAKCWKHEANERPSMSEVVAELTAGSMHFLQDMNRQMSLLSTTSTTSSTSSLDFLERELVELLAPLRSYAVKPSWFTFQVAGSIVGAGGCGTVHRVEMRRNRLRPPVVVAVKMLRPVGGRDKRLRMTIALIRELVVWSNLQHTNVVPFVGYYLDTRLQGAWLVAPYMRNGNLSDYLRQVIADEEARVLLALDTANGLHYLHNLDPPVCHGDIKSLNVLITDDRRAVLCDFGLARTMESMPSGLTTSTFNQGGSLPYESPELLLGISRRTKESDVWAWGCVLQEIFSGRYPYFWANNPGAIVKWIIQDIPPATLDEIECPARVRRLLGYCWQSRSALRPTMAQCVTVLTRGEDGVDETVWAELEDVLPVEALRLKKADLLYDATTRLGSGQFGTVYRATLRGVVGSTPEEVVAVKELFHAFDETERARLERGVRSWAVLKHPNVFPFRGFCDEDGKVFLVSPLHSGGTLGAYLEKDTLTYARRMELATEIAQGLLYLHSRDPPIWHGNVHLGNVFMSLDGHPVLSDYGLATTVNKMNVIALNQTDEGPRYQSPEVLTGASRPTARSDVWSWSCLFLKIITGKMPYESVVDADSLMEHICHNRAFPATVDVLDCPPRAQNIMGHCWKHDPELRPAMGEVLAILTGQASRFEKVTDITITEQGTVYGIGFSADGQYIAVVLDDAVHIVSTDTWKVTVRLLFPRRCDDTKGIKFSPSNRFVALALAESDYAVWVWDLRSGELHKTLLGMPQTVVEVDISADDTFLVASSYSGHVRLWRLDDGEGRVLGQTTRAFGYAVAISPNCNLVAAGFDNGRLCFWDKQDRTEVASIARGNDGAIWCTEFSPDGCWLFSSGAFGMVRRWEVGAIHKDGSEAGCTVYEVQQDGRLISTLSISPDNAWFAAIAYVHGDLHVVQSRNPDSARSSLIGQLPTCGSWRGLSLGPISNNASGLAAGVTGGYPGTGVAVYKYASWDFPGAYLV